ncbi:unnamed protein product [Linum trigynum]|uniref:Uncharacterized protein n=1 Tax=Linum trigynum TaxID=586398 RepID=A0AAV2D8J0_9ROSI
MLVINQVANESAMEVGASSSVVGIETPPVTPSAFPSEEAFSRVVNGVKPREVQASSPPRLENSFAAICARPPVIIKPVHARVGREGLRSGKGVALAAHLTK